MVRNMLCENDFKNLEAREDPGVFKEAKREQARAPKKPAKRVAGRIFKIKTGEKVFTMISMDDITEAEALKFVQGKWANAEIV